MATDAAAEPPAPLPKAEAGSRAVVLDPAWNRRVGHHPDVNAALLRALQAAGWRAQVWADAALPPPPGLAVLGCFRGCGYEDPRYWADVAGTLELARRLEGQIRARLEESKPEGPVGAWIVHTALPYQLLGVARGLLGQPAAAVVVSLMFDPGETLEGAVDDPQAIAHGRLALAALAATAQRAGHRLRIGVGSGQQQQRWAPLLAAAGLPPAERHPPVVGAGVDFVVPPAAAPHEPQRVLLHWGDLKPGKGRAEALAVVEQLLERPQRLPEVLRQARWLFHCCSAEQLPAGERQWLERAQAELPGFVWRQEWVEEGEMLAELASCRLALLAYGVEAYRHRSSGLLWSYGAARRRAGLPAAAVGHGTGWLAQEAAAQGVAWQEVCNGDWLAALVRGMDLGAPVEHQAQEVEPSFASWVVGAVG